jgi:hypothetical protein
MSETRDLPFTARIPTHSLMRALSDGRLFRHGFSLLIRLSAILLAIILVGESIEVWKQHQASPLTAVSTAVLAGLQVLVILAAWLALHTLVVRARQARGIHDHQYTLLPLASLMLRLMGELAALCVLARSWMEGLLQVTDGPRLDTLVHLPTMPSLTPDVLRDLMMQTHTAWEWLAIGPIAGFVVLAVAYLLAESITLLIDLSRNVRGRP